MNQDERLDQIRREATGLRDAVTMILSACVDTGSTEGALFGVAADMLVAYLAGAERPSGGRIDREVLTQIEDVQRELATFHGFRKLWGCQVANGAATADGLHIDENVLMAEQHRALKSAVYFAMKLFDRLWPEESPPHIYFERVPENKGIDVPRKEWR